MSSFPNIDGCIMVAGAGVSGRGCINLLRHFDNPIIVLDANPIAIQQCSALAPDQVRGFHPDHAVEELSGVGLIVTSPGWRPDTPLFQQAATQGIEVIGDVEMTYRIDQAGVFGEPRRWVGVTGTNGKSTTTAMLASMIQKADPATLAVGNIGMAVADALLTPQRINTLVVEFSSFQLHWSSTVHLEAGVFLNLAEDHLDWHGGMQGYTDSKMKILHARHSFAGIDDHNVLNALAERGMGDKVIGFSMAEPVRGSVGFIEHNIVDWTGAEPVVLASAEGIDPPGPAGVLDALAASAVAYSCGVQPAQIQQALKEFRVAGHRGQVVYDHGEIRAIDNSKATNPHAADAALAGVNNILWFAGGQLKGADVSDVIKRHAPRMKAAFLLGVDRQIIAQHLAALAPDLPVIISESTDPEDAMRELVEASQHYAQPGDTLVLVPAAASLDMYRGMGERGDIFTRWVNSTYMGS